MSKQFKVKITVGETEDGNILVNFMSPQYTCTRLFEFEDFSTTGEEVMNFLLRHFNKLNMKEALGEIKWINSWMTTLEENKKELTK